LNLSSVLLVNILVFAHMGFNILISYVQEFARVNLGIVV